MGIPHPQWKKDKDGLMYKPLISSIQVSLRMTLIFFISRNHGTLGVQKDPSTPATSAGCTGQREGSKGTDAGAGAAQPEQGHCQSWTVLPTG